MILIQDLGYQATFGVKVAMTAATAIGMHLCLFIHGEWHLHGAKICFYHILAAVLYYCLIVSGENRRAEMALVETGGLLGFYVITLFTSIVIYRVFFHPLSREGFPGPLSVRTSKIWHAWACRRSKNFLYLDNLARQYGDFVRTGPSELTILHPDVYQAIDGRGSECTKAEWYDITHPQVSLVSARDPQAHEYRRRLWDRGFSTKALAEYRLRIVKYLRMLDDLIHTDVTAGKSSDAASMFAWFAFDFMGEFCFGRSLNLLQDQQQHSIAVQIQEALNLMGPTTPLPWLVHLAFDTCGFLPQVKTWFSMNRWSREQMELSVQASEEHDSSHEVSHWLIEDARSHGFTETDWKWLSGDAILAIVAGSHPVKSTLTCLFYHLARDPSQAEKLYNEVADVDCLDDHTLQTLPHLNGIIQETLRLHPALISAGARKTPKAGMRIGGRFVPGEITIVAPRYSIFRREDCFEKADCFVPERWSEFPEMVKNKNGFAPFGTGRYSCVGKNLGMTQIRLVTATLVQKYSVSFCSEAQATSFPDQTTDCFISNVGPLELRFQPRATSVEA